MSTWMVALTLVVVLIRVLIDVDIGIGVDIDFAAGIVIGMSCFLAWMHVCCIWYTLLSC